MNSYWQGVLFLHGESEMGIVGVVQLPHVLLLVMGENPPSRAPIATFLFGFHSLVAQQKVISVNFTLLTKTFSGVEFVFIFFYNKSPISNYN